MSKKEALFARSWAFSPIYSRTLYRSGPACPPYAKRELSADKRLASRYIIPQNDRKGLVWMEFLKNTTELSSIKVRKSTLIRAQLWACGSIMALYSFSNLLNKIWYIGTALVLLYTIILVLCGVLRIDGLVKACTIPFVYFGYLLLTSQWAMYPSETVLWVAIDSIFIIIVGLFYLMMLNNSVDAVTDVFVVITYITLPVTVILYLIKPDSIRFGGYATKLLPLLLVFCVSAIEDKSRLLKSAIALMVGLGIVIISKSRTPLLACAITLPIISWWTSSRLVDSTRKMIILALVVAIGVGCLMAFEPTREMVTESMLRITGDEEISIQGTLNASSDDIRDMQYKMGMYVLLTSQPWGIGYMNFASMINDVLGYPVNLHNSVLTWGAEGGLPCVLIVLFMFYKYFALAKRTMKKSLLEQDVRFCKSCIVAMVGVLITAMFHQAHQAPPMYILIGIVYALPQKDKRPKRILNRNWTAPQVTDTSLVV
ncbi:MAG: O-antigen ligase family protein [Armatimonadetes bacterium]|nr:O-antigen ligase family protein [Armatimonadota bacterium]